LRNVYRRNHQRCVAGVLRIGGEKAEHVVDRFGDGLICGHKAQVGINLCRGGVVVAGSEVGIAPRNSIWVFPHKKGQLAMGLESNEAMKNLYTSIFQIARPAYV